MTDANPNSPIESSIASLEDLNQAAAQVTFLSEAGRVLASSIDLKTTFNHLANIIIPALADACIISLLRPDGTIERVVLRHINKSREEMLPELDRKYPSNPDAETGAPFVIKTRGPELVPQLEEQDSESNPGLHAMIWDIGIRSYLTVPMILKDTGKIVGAFWLATSDDSNRRLSSKDLNLARDLSVLAAQAVNNSLLYQSAVNESDRYQIVLKIRDEFLRREIHDIKTPLTAASLNLQMLIRAGKEPPETVSRIQRALDNVERAASIADNLHSIESEHNQRQTTRVARETPSSPAR